MQRIIIIILLFLSTVSYTWMDRIDFHIGPGVSFLFGKTPLTTVKAKDTASVDEKLYVRGLASNVEMGVGYFGFLGIGYTLLPSYYDMIVGMEYQLGYGDNISRLPIYLSKGEEVGGTVNHFYMDQRIRVYIKFIIFKEFVPLEIVPFMGLGILSTGDLTHTLEERERDALNIKAVHLLDAQTALGVDIGLRMHVSTFFVGIDGFLGKYLPLRISVGAMISPRVIGAFTQPKEE